MTEQVPYGWISGGGTFTFAPSVTGAGHSCVPVTLTADGGRLTVGCDAGSPGTVEDDEEDRVTPCP